MVGTQDPPATDDWARGEALAKISRQIVQLFSDAAGKGPTRCKTYFAGRDVVLVLLGGGYTRGEETLYRSGRSDEADAYRRALQGALSGRMQAVVEDVTGRRVEAFMSANHKDPDMAAEIFVLRPDPEPG